MINNEFKCFKGVVTVAGVFKAQDEQRTVGEQEARESYYGNKREAINYYTLCFSFLLLH